MQNQKHTEQMVQFFTKRTKEHIDRVINNMTAMQGFQGLSLKQLVERGKLHDKSKYQSPENQPYIWLTWYHKCKNQGKQFGYPQGMIVEVKKAIQHHKSVNRHHPEFHKNVEEMSTLDLVQMVCDWTAMSQEYKQGSCLNYVNANIENWGFSQERKEIIFKYIAEIDGRLAKKAQN